MQCALWRGLYRQAPQGAPALGWQGVRPLWAAGRVAGRAVGWCWGSRFSLVASTPDWQQPGAALRRGGSHAGMPIACPGAATACPAVCTLSRQRQAAVVQRRLSACPVLPRFGGSSPPLRHQPPKALQQQSPIECSACQLGQLAMHVLAGGLARSLCCCLRSNAGLLVAMVCVIG